MTNPFMLTTQELAIIHQAGWMEDPFNDLPRKFYHPTVKDQDGRFQRLNGAQVLKLIQENMQKTLSEGIDY